MRLFLRKLRNLTYLTSQIGLFLLLALILIIQTGCKQPIENPELADPIYSDLLSQVNGAKSAIASEEKSIKDLKDQIAALKPRDSSRGPLLRELAAHERALVQAKQQKTYFEIRSQQRKEYDQKAYQEAFDRDLPWPNPEEVEEYKKTKKLLQASRNWEDRVPKTTRYNKNQPGTEEKKEKKAEGGEGGGAHH